LAYQQSDKMALRKQARRRELLDTAIRLFGRLGYHATTVPMIVAEAHSSTGAFYLYFRGKEDVYVAALYEFGVRISAGINDATARESRQEARMGVAVQTLVRWLAANPSEARILMEAAALGGRMEEARREIIESHVRSVAMALEQLAPWFESTERATVARCWVGSVLEAVVGWMNAAPDARIDPERLGRIVAIFNLRGAALISSTRQQPAQASGGEHRG